MFDFWQVFEIVIVVVGFAGTIYTLKSDVKGVKSDVTKLEKKQDKYNNLQERTMKAEEACKSAHHRLDDKDTQYSNILEKIDDIKDLLMKHVEVFHTKKGSD